jgi:ketosteroid isomerase-like protein
MKGRASKGGSKKTSSIRKARGSAGAEQALEKKAYEYAEALTKRDVKALDEIWSPNYTFVNPRGELLSKPQRIANVQSGTTEFRKMSPQKERLNVHGNFAVEVGRILVEGEYGGQESSGEYRYTTVWVKMQGRWRMLANQITLIAR